MGTMENNYFFDYQEEISQRENILNKVRNKIKISPEERLWLATHSLYNLKSGNNTFNIVVERIIPRSWYLLKIKIESVSYDNRIIPIIAVPAGKGKIISSFVRDLDGKIKVKKAIKMLGLEAGKNVLEYEVEYFSELGLLSVEYESDYFDTLTKLNMRESSSTGNPDFAIKRQVVNDSTIRYFCKSPIGDCFSALVFSIHFQLKNV